MATFPKKSVYTKWLNATNALVDAYIDQHYGILVEWVWIKGRVGELILVDDRFTVTLNKVIYDLNVGEDSKINL